jgi:hypothetical protein
MDETVLPAGPGCLYPPAAPKETTGKERNSFNRRLILSNVGGLSYCKEMCKIIAVYCTPGNNHHPSLSNRFVTHECINLLINKDRETIMLDNIIGNNNGVQKPKYIHSYFVLLVAYETISSSLVRGFR